jgi:hypothetical protein
LALPTAAINTTEVTSRQKQGSTIKTSERKASKNITLMLIVTSFIYIIGTLPSKTNQVIGLVYPSAPFLDDLSIAGVVVLYMFPGVKLIVYISFNKLFRQQIKDYLKIFKL